MITKNKPIKEKIQEKQRIKTIKYIYTKEKNIIARVSTCSISQSVVPHFGMPLNIICMTGGFYQLMS